MIVSENPTFPEAVSRLLRREIIASQFCVETVARKAKISPQYLYRLMSGRQSPSFEIICRIATVIDVSVEALRPETPIEEEEKKPKKRSK